MVWRTSLAAVAVVVLASFSSCSCNESPAACSGGSKACSTDDDCPEANVCHTASGASCCVRSARKCAADSDCCPGQTCTGDSKCVDQFDECATDSDCGETPDRVCREWTDPRLGTTKRCTYAPCGSDGQCPDGQACFDQVCVVNPPCGGQCPAGTACVPQAAGGGKCHPYGNRCDLPPKPGFMVVFTKPTNIFDTCTLADVACEYAELPPLAAIDVARHPSGAVTSGKISVAMYDGHYGDLVVSDYDLTGKKLKSVWVDGVPATGSVIGAPSGPRNGLADPGPDVGKYTSTAARADGTLSVSYYDQTNGDLRYAERAPDGSWTTHRVDGATADVGMYTSLVLDPNGRPAIAYFMRARVDTSKICEQGSPTSDDLLTGVKLARARVDHPRSEADWIIELVDSAERPLPPCCGCASAGKACVQDATAANGTVCKTATVGGCSPACASGEVCVAGDAGNLCMAQGSSTELADVPWGTGLYPSLAFRQGNPAIAYYDRAPAVPRVNQDRPKGNLVVAQASGSGWARQTIDGEDTTGDTGDVGAFPSLVIDSSGKYLIAYSDLTRRGLRFYSKPTLAPVDQQRTPPVSAFIDTGISDAMGDGPAWVGANASLVSTAGVLYVAYQNSTAGDLRLAKQSAGVWTVAKQWTQGSLGFFAHTLLLSDGVLVLHTRIHAKIAGGRAVPDNELRLEFVRPAP